MQEASRVSHRAQVAEEDERDPPRLITGSVVQAGAYVEKEDANMERIESPRHTMKIKNLQRVQSSHMSAHDRHDAQGMTGGSEDDILMDLKDVWDDPPEDPKLLRTKLQDIKARVLHGDIQVDNEEQLRAFMVTDDAEYVGCITDNEQENFLHMLASDTQNRYLIKFLVEERSQLMFGTDRSMYYPFHVAIKEKNTDFIMAVLDSKFSKTDDMKKVLSHKGGSKPGNCIHLGIQVGLDPQLMIRLIEKSNKDTLAEQDGAGLTPLHWAVAYKNCRKGQFEVVQALLKYGDAALDKRGSIHGSLSPYQYHEETKRIEKKKLEEAEWLKRQDGTGSQQSRVGSDNRGVRDPSHNSGLGDHWKVPEDDEEDAKERKNLLDLDSRVHNTRRQSVAIRADSTGARVKSPTRGILTGGSSTTPPPTIDRLLDSQNPSPANLGRPRKAMRSSRPGVTRRSLGSQRFQQHETPPDDEIADQISKELKLHYLRSIFKGSAYSGSLGSADGDRPEPRNHDRAVRFLYGDNKENRHICFNFLDGPSKMTADKFRTTYGGFKFDHVLQYVGFRRLEFTSPDLPPRGGTMPKAPLSSGKGRKDMEEPFNWLHDKGVTNIMKVIVDDLEPPSHKDESIQNALKKFDIEILDWRKIDLCPETIYRSCPNLREAHLWWSGNNGILRAWSEPEGLARLERLETIQIHQTQELESESWTDMNIATFRKMLRELRNAQNSGRKSGDKLPQIRVPDPIKAIDGPAQRPTGLHPKTDPKVQRETHKWLHIMDTFADGIYKIKPDRDPEFFDFLPPELKRDVKVALIDDGVQFGHESLQEKIQDGWSFDDGYDGVDLPGARRPFHESSTGHGTLMANMICRICPNAKIFVCRLNVYPGDGAKSHFSAKSAADAAEYCATRGFDIISMSWTIRKPTYTPDSLDYDKDLDRLQKALDAACKNGALLFCSAPDEGGMSDEKFREYYPVGCASLSNRIFKIGAATSTNKEADRTGKTSQLDFILPGHEVRERGNDTIKVDDSLKSGSSVATALAAGIAALVIHCVRLGAIETIRARTTKRNGDTRKSEDDITGQESTKSEDAAKNEGNTKEDMKTALEAVAIKLEDFADIKKFEHMMRVFAGIPRQRKGGETWKYLEVDNTFEGPGKTLVNKEAPESQKILAVMKLAMNFISSGQSKL